MSCEFVWGTRSQLFGGGGAIAPRAPSSYVPGLTQIDIGQHCVHNCTEISRYLLFVIVFDRRVQLFSYRQRTALTFTYYINY